MMHYFIGGGTVACGQRHPGEIAATSVTEDVECLSCVGQMRWAEKRQRRERRRTREGS